MVSTHLLLCVHLCITSNSYIAKLGSAHVGFVDVSRVYTLYNPQPVLIEI